MTTPRTELDSRFSDPAAQPTSWEDTLEAIKQAEIFWISTVRKDGRPHVTPLVAVWLDDALHFSTGPDEQKARNLASNPRVALTTGANDWQSGLDVVLEGEAARVTGAQHSTGSPRPGRRSGTGDGNTRSVRMAFDTTSGPRSCSPSTQRRSLLSPRAASATPDIASETPTPFPFRVRNDAISTPHAFPLEPTAIHVPDGVLDDLRARLALTRPPLDEGNGDWSYGVADSYLRELVVYWRDGYDWRKAEAAMNAYEHYQVSVAGVPLHFMRKPGRGPRPASPTSGTP